MESILFFIIFSGIWAVADAVFAPIISSLLGISEDSSECLVGIILGVFTGYFFGLLSHLAWNRKHLVG